MLIRKPLQSVVVKTCASICNLKCDYCFYLNKELKYVTEQRMDDATLEVFIRQIMQQSGTSFGIVWQGGEPSLAGASFFRKAIALMEQYGDGKNKVISNLLQTNGYHLNDELMDVLSEYSFLTGLSIDGPEDIHNAYRKTPNGKGSWKEAMQTWEKLQSRHIATNILSCITKLSANKAQKLYRFFQQNEMTWLQFIPVWEQDENGKPTDFSLSAETWGSFMCETFDLWYDDFMNSRPAPNIRFIENAFHLHLGMKAPECTFMEECGTYLVLEHNGDVFSCDYLVDADTHLGNIHQNKLIELLNSPQQLGFGQHKKQTHADCTDCPWLKYCYGGCPKYRNKQTYKYEFCESWKKFLEYSQSRFTPIVEAYKQSHPASERNTLDISGYLYLD